MEKLLTISVAAYNVEEYLPKLITSIVEAERINEVEVLIINDGSTDMTASVASEYEKTYPGIVRAVNKENGGHGSTINRGILEASGKYFRALDGDDWINTCDFNKLILALEQETADAILCNYLSCYEGGKVVEEDFEGLESGRLYDFDDIASIVGWMRYHTLIYRTAILKENNINLDEHCFYVDAEFMLFPIPYLQKIRFYDWHIYCYRLGLEGQSVSIAGRLKHVAESYKVSLRLLEMYRNLPKEISSKKRNYIVRGIGKHCIWHYRTVMSFKYSKEKKRELIDFEKLIRDTSLDIYKSMEEFGNLSRLIIVMRRTHYFMYKPICVYKQIKKGK